MKPSKIRLFIKPWCGWCREAQDWLDQRAIRYQMIDVTADQAAHREMQNLSGQSLAPVLEVNGQILADFDTGQLAEFWKRLDGNQPPAR